MHYMLTFGFVSNIINISYLKTNVPIYQYIQNPRIVRDIRDHSGVHHLENLMMFIGFWCHNVPLHTHPRSANNDFFVPKQLLVTVNDVESASGEATTA